MKDTALILQLSATAARPRSAILRDAWCGGAFRVLTAIRSSAACLRATRRKDSADVVLHGMVDFQSEYLRNTAVVSTVLTDQNGGAVRITDFAPRYRHFGRVFRPPQLMRIIEPVAGLPRITIRFRPTHHYGRAIRAAFDAEAITYAIWTKGRSSGSPRCAALLYRARGPVRAHPPGASRLRGR